MHPESPVCPGPKKSLSHQSVSQSPQDTTNNLPGETSHSQQSWLAASDRLCKAVQGFASRPARLAPCHQAPLRLHPRAFTEPMDTIFRKNKGFSPLRQPHGSRSRHSSRKQFRHFHFTRSWRGDSGILYPHLNVGITQHAADTCGANTSANHRSRYPLFPKSKQCVHILAY